MIRPAAHSPLPIRRASHGKSTNPSYYKVREVRDLCMQVFLRSHDVNHVNEKIKLHTDVLNMAKGIQCSARQLFVFSEIKALGDYLCIYLNWDSLSDHDKKETILSHFEAFKSKFFDCKNQSSWNSTTSHCFEHNLFQLQFISGMLLTLIEDIPNQTIRSSLFADYKAMLKEFNGYMRRHQNSTSFKLTIDKLNNDFMNYKDIESLRISFNTPTYLLTQETVNTLNKCNLDDFVSNIDSNLESFNEMDTLKAIKSAYTALLELSDRYRKAIEILQKVKDFPCFLQQHNATTIQSFLDSTQKQFDMLLSINTFHTIEKIDEAILKLHELQTFPQTDNT